MKKIKPMLAGQAPEAFDRKGWIFEIKWDGYRAIAQSNKEIQLYSRNGILFNEKYPTIFYALRTMPPKTIFDGEVVAVDETARPSFQLLQHPSAETKLLYVIFDILYFKGKNLMDAPLVERKKILQKCMPTDPLLMYSDHLEDDGKAFYKKSVELGFEGIMAKDGLSRYVPGVRSTSWLKIKSEKRQEAIIVGFTEPRGGRKKFGALVLAVYRDKKLICIGHTGGGFDEKNLEMVYEKLVPLITDIPTITEKIPLNGPVTWVKPKLVAEIKFKEWTADGRMRQPIFVALREDKSPHDVLREKPEKIAFTNRDKIFWPEEKYTKGDVIDYYEKIAPVMLPYLKDRPENLYRTPHGISKTGFFQKDFNIKLPPFVETFTFRSETEERDITYLVCQNKETLLYMAQLGCIEINPWNSRTTSIEKPDYLIMDLDPGDANFSDLISVTRTVHEILDHAQIPNFCKTSGKRGLHVCVPMNARYTYEQSRQFAELIANIVHKKIPELTSIERVPGRRAKGTIYVDFLQNRIGQTLAAPYSIRPWPGATVSTPLTWDEAAPGLDPARFNIRTIFKRLDEIGDIWKPVIGKGIDLKVALKSLEDYMKKEDH